MGKGNRVRETRLSQKEEEMAQRLLKSDMEKGYRICLDEALNFTNIAVSRGDFPKEKYMEGVTRAIYYTAWGDCERNLQKDRPTGLSRETKDLIADLAEFKGISIEKSEQLIMGTPDTMTAFLEGCKDLGVKVKK